VAALPDELTVLVASDAQWIRDQVRLAFVGPGHRVVEVTSGQAVRDLVAEEPPDLVILDLQIGNMGGIAVAIDLHLEAASWRLDPVPIVLLLDREADRFLARRAEAQAELVKPVDAGALRRTVAEVLERWDPLHGPQDADREAGADGDDDTASATLS